MEKSVEKSDSEEAPTIHVYRRRYLVLVLFMFLSGSNSMQWIEYSVIANIINKFYSVSYTWIDWTSMIFMLTYVILVIPASWVVDRFGLRFAVLIAATGNCIGAWIKAFSTSPDLFWLSFLGQLIVGSSQVFILGIPSRLAAVWFGSRQVATACAAGVFGNQIGIAVGFLIPPLIVTNGDTGTIARGLRTLFIGSAVVNSVIFVLILSFFSKQPKQPPSKAQLAIQSSDVHQDYTNSLKSLITNSNYLLLLVTYGINVGVFYAISTLLNQMILAYHKDAQESVGTIGLLLVVAGMVGSVIAGVVLDKFNHYKLTTVIVYLFSFIGMLLFTLLLSLNELWYMFVTSALLGFFMTGYLPIGFEFAAEITFPVPEATSSGLLNGAAQVFGILMTTCAGRVIHQINILTCNIILTAFLFAGTLLTMLIKPDLKRQSAQKTISQMSPSDTNNNGSQLN
ncbi:hypothetical protein AB6A40_002715 [Gnathostoma spinigerum]|uniref:Choline/ethanolamine transporter FLVCR1 n=1 Tax=Gnathostoma spinigerum TaxID=75299 RepID=A0ABD6E9X9_9BILA